MNMAALVNGIMYRGLDQVELIYWVSGQKTQETSFHISELKKFNPELIGDHGIRRSLRAEDIALVRQYIIQYCKEKNIFNAFNNDKYYIFCGDND
jgi:hypothetical protein